MVRPEGKAVAPVKKRKRVSRQQLTREIWEEAEEAVRAVAIRRGWPHETYEDLMDAVRRLAAEYPEHWMGLIAGFGGTCSLYHYNLIHPFMDLEEIRWFQPTVKDFINLVGSLE